MKYLIGNWKSNFILDDIEPYFHVLNKSIENLDISKINFILCVPYLWIYLALKYASKKIKIGAQDVSGYGEGSYTSQINAKMLKSLVKLTLIGHSETIKYQHVSNAEIRNKIKEALDNNLDIILCIGETLETYKEFKTVSYLINLLDELLNGFNFHKIVIAYEPIWSIGTGQTPTNEEINSVAIEIKKYFASKFNLNVDVLYGGSVNEQNIHNLKLINNIDGFLVGNISLNCERFLKLIKAMLE